MVEKTAIKLLEIRKNTFHTDELQIDYLDSEANNNKKKFSSR